MRSQREGYVSYKGHRTFYQIFGEPSSKKKPLLVLHGGPGSAHNYLLGLAELQKDRQIIFYDQLGCGESDMPNDDSLWTLNTFVGEVTAVRETLKLESLHLFGHSWGGMLAIEYLLKKKPRGIQSVTLASSMISIPLYQEEVDKLKQALPGRAYTIMKEHERAGTTDSPEYRHAYMLYRKRHLFRAEVFPSKFSLPEEKNGSASYRLLWGTNEACADGELRSWDRVEELSKITIPTLITSGQYDELTPWQAGITRDNIPNACLRIFTNGSHLVHIEQQQTYLNVLDNFLNQHE